MTSLEPGCNRSEVRIQSGADRLHCGDYHDGYAAGDEGIFDRRGTCLILQEAQQWHGRPFFLCANIITPRNEPALVTLLTIGGQFS